MVERSLEVQARALNAWTSSGMDQTQKWMQEKLLNEYDDTVCLYAFRQGVEEGVHLLMLAFLSDAEESDGIVFDVRTLNPTTYKVSGEEMTIDSLPELVSAVLLKLPTWIPPLSGRTFINLRPIPFGQS